MRFGAVILAAGLSSRMRSFKPLLVMGNGTVLEQVVQTFRHAEVTPVVVTGHQHAEVETVARKLNVVTVHNHAYESGMFSSIKSGFVYMADQPYAGVFLLPTDIPLIRYSTLSFMQSDFTNNFRNFDLWHPIFNHKKGHPPLLKMPLVRDISQASADGNLRDILSDLPDERKQLVSVCDKFILQDMDYPADYVDLLDEYDHYDVLAPSEAYALLLKYRGDQPQLIAHSLKVMQVALRLALRLKYKNAGLNVRLVQSCALLHDIGKGFPNHACFSAELLAGLELTRMGYVTGCHSGFALSQGLSAFLGEDELAAKIVYIADKFVSSNSGNHLVTIKERFDSARRRFGDNPEAAANINRYHNEAKRVCAEISRFLGQPIEDVVLRN